MSRLGSACQCLVVVSALFLLAGVHDKAAAQSVADFYKGKTITVTVGSGTGGGYDMHARLLARHLGRFLPGNPSLIVQNMPGGQGFTNANWLYNIAPKDGTVMAMFQKLIITAPYLKPEVVKYDGPKFNWIGSTTGERSVAFLWHTAPQKSVEDVRREETIVGGSGDSAILAKVYNQVIGTKFKIIRGYPGTNDVIIAMQRGEVQGVGSFSWSNIPAKYPDWISEKKITVLFQGGKTPARELPDVPLMINLVGSEEDREILDLWTAPEDVARPFAMPPGVPADRVAAVRAAFMTMTADADYVGDARKQGLEIDARPGEEIDKLYDKLNAIPADVVAAARAFEE